MGWIKLSSIFFIIVFVIFLTLGGREFFEYFDVGITKKNASENANVTETKENQVTETKEIQVTDKHENNKDQEDKIQEKEQKDDEWSEFN
jgi:exopolysaccharide biosynthesis protein|tara:strand:- start:133 stop:402 length:270 start_codon:yes stop_codon:yes gene_type:complete